MSTRLYTIALFAVVAGCTDIEPEGQDITMVPHNAHAKASDWGQGLYGASSIASVSTYWESDWEIIANGDFQPIYWSFPTAKRCCMLMHS
ncbi:MAG: hypothetical protein HN348_32380 [Proteobacteria bacterium]|jgi:hypothetical protein|nr:hypothetical protein [Pseudomonadota bacterium]